MKTDFAALASPVRTSAQILHPWYKSAMSVQKHSGQRSMRRPPNLSTAIYKCSSGTSCTRPVNCAANSSISRPAALNVVNRRGMASAEVMKIMFSQQEKTLSKMKSTRQPVTSGYLSLLVRARIAAQSFQHSIQVKAARFLTRGELLISRQMLRHIIHRRQDQERPVKAPHGVVL